MENEKQEMRNEKWEKGKEKWLELGHGKWEMRNGKWEWPLKASVYISKMVFLQFVWKQFMPANYRYSITCKTMCQKSTYMKKIIKSLFMQSFMINYCI